MGRKLGLKSIPKRRSQASDDDADWTTVACEDLDADLEDLRLQEVDIESIL